MADEAPQTSSTSTAPETAPVVSKADAEETKKWEDIKAEARARGVERGHRTDEAEPAKKTEPAKKADEKPAKAEAKPKADAAPVRDDKGRFVPKDGEAKAKVEPEAKPKVEATAKPKVETAPVDPKKAEDPKPPEAEPEKPKRPQRTDAEINASFARLKREKREIDAERQAVAQEREQHESWKREQASDRELREKDPYGWLEKHGFDLVDVARETKRRSEMTPVERESSDLKKQIAALQATVEELKKSPPVAPKSAELHELEEARPFLERAASAHEVLSASEYPMLAAEDSRDVARAALHIDHQHWQRTQKHLDLRSIFRILEGNLTPPAEAAPSEEHSTAGAIRTESENGGPTDTGNRPPAVNHSLSARTTARQKPERGSREAAIRRLEEMQRS